MKRLAVWFGLGVLTGFGIIAARSVTMERPQYFWYDVAQTDSVRTLLNASEPGTVRLKFEERTKRHVWISVVPKDTVATQLRKVAPFEVQESTWCPPLCLE